MKSLPEVLDEIDIRLTFSSKAAASMGDDLLMYVLDMAILHVRKKAVKTTEPPPFYSETPTPMLLAAERVC